MGGWRAAWNDTRTADFNARFVNGWRAAFPEFNASPFYIIGESYAGVYVPMLTQRLLDQSTPPPVPIAGMALGDACEGVDELCGNPLPGP